MRHLANTRLDRKVKINWAVKAKVMMGNRIYELTNGDVMKIPGTVFESGNVNGYIEKMTGGKVANWKEVR